MAAALIDRLVHHCHIVNIRGNSYRMRARQELWRGMLGADSDTGPPRGTRPHESSKERGTVLEWGAAIPAADLTPNLRNSWSPLTHSAGTASTLK